MGYFVKIVDENGTPYGVKHIDNKIRVSAMSYLYDIVEGNVASHYGIHKYGVNTSVGTAYETVYRGSTQYVYITTATKLYFSGAAGVDRSNGTGARTIYISGLNADYNAATEIVTMNGATAVPTTNKYLRIQDCWVDTAGSAGANSGTISIKNQAGSTTYDTLAASTGFLQSAVWTVPANHTAYITMLNGSESANKAVEFDIAIRPFGKAWQRRRPIMSVNGFAALSFNLPIGPLAEKTDIKLTAKATQAGAIVSAGFEGWYESE